MFKPISFYTKPIMERLARLQTIQRQIDAMDTAALKKSHIMTLHGYGIIGDDDCSMLIEVYGLEAE